MLLPVSVEDILEALTEGLVLPPLDAAPVYVRRMVVPLIAGVPHPEAVCIAQGCSKVNISDLLLRPDMVEIVQPRARGEHIGVGAGADLGLSPAERRRFQRGSSGHT